MNPIGINPHIMEVNTDGIFYATFYLRRIISVFSPCCLQNLYYLSGIKTQIA